jgi:hypothetical protein
MADASMRIRFFYFQFFIDDRQRKRAFHQQTPSARGSIRLPSAAAW